MDEIPTVSSLYSFFIVLCMRLNRKLARQDSFRCDVARLFFFLYIYFNVTFSQQLPLSTNLFNLRNDLRTNLGELFCSRCLAKGRLARPSLFTHKSGNKWTSDDAARAWQVQDCLKVKVHAAFTEPIGHKVPTTHFHCVAQTTWLRCFHFGGVEKLGQTILEFQVRKVDSEVMRYLNKDDIAHYLCLTVWYLICYPRGIWFGAVNTNTSSIRAHNKYN